jgi:uncharacterized membrane protein
MMIHYLFAFLISMVPIIELRGAVIYAVAMDLKVVPALLICTLGNMIPVPFIYFFARTALRWGAKRRFVGRFCSWVLRKGEIAGEKLLETAGKNGMFLAMMLFVGIPLPGTGAWIGTLGASLLHMEFKSTVLAVSLGVIMAAAIMMALSLLGFGIFT